MRKLLLPALLVACSLIACKPAKLVMYDQLQVFDTVINGRIKATNIGAPVRLEKHRGDTIHFLFFKTEKP